MRQNKIDLVVFGTLSEKGHSGLALFHYRLAKSLHEENLLHAVYCLSCREISGLEGVRVMAMLENPFWLLMVKVLRRVRSMRKGFPSRLYEERLFDYWCRNKIAEYSKIAVITKPVVPGLMVKLRKQHTRTCVIATVAHPLFIKKQVNELENRYQIKDQSSYTNQTRISRLLKVFGQADFVIPRIPSVFIKRTYLENNIPVESLLDLGADRKIDTDLFSPGESKSDEQDLIFLTVGFMNLKKGLPLLLEAWKAAKKQLGNSRLIVVGKLDASTTLAVAKLGELPGVVFEGHQSKVSTYYKKADVFIASSVSDLGPRTIQEALASGLPVISSSHCGMADFIKDGENGFIYNPWDTDELVQHMIYFYENRMEVSKMGDKARESCFVENNTSFMGELIQQCNTLIQTGDEN